MAKLQIKKGTTSKRLGLFIQNSSVTTGAGLTGLVFNSAGLSWYYWRENEGNVGATVVTLATATRGTFASGGFIEKDATNMPGFYEIGLPDAALATGAHWVVMQLKGATNMAQLTLEIELTNSDTQDGADFGLSTLSTLLARIVGTLATGTHQPQTGDSFARLGAPAGASVSADILTIDNFVDDLEARVGTPTDFGSGTATIAANLQDLADNGIAVYDRATDSLQAIRDTAPLGTAMRGTDSAALASVCTEARLAELDAANLPTDVLAIKAKTDSLVFGTGNRVSAILDTSASVTPAAANRLADFVLRRSISNTEDNADGGIDSETVRSLYGAVCKLVNLISTLETAGSLTLYKSNDLTVLARQTLTTDATALPITSANTV